MQGRIQHLGISHRLDLKGSRYPHAIDHDDGAGAGDGTSAYHTLAVDGNGFRPRSVQLIYHSKQVFRMDEIGVPIPAASMAAVGHGNRDPRPADLRQPRKGKQLLHFRVKGSVLMLLHIFFQCFILFQQCIPLRLHLVQGKNGFGKSLIFRGHPLLFYRIHLHPDDDPKDDAGGRQGCGILFFYHRLYLISVADYVK